ncbi:MAG: hypothetical protein JWR72_1404 [Flavisolibacter sp.]|jgi:hypothetical protein|nr:hypothetical protein [Flavisolibacter sp.]
MTLGLLLFFQMLYAQGYNLIAKKGSREIYYSIGSPLRIKLQGDSLKKIRGYLFKAVENGLYLLSFNKTDTGLHFVPMNHIRSVVKLSRKSRKTMLYAAAAGVALTGVFIIASKGSVLSSPMGYVAFIPAFASAFAIVYGLPISYVAELFTKKTTGNGWAFVAQ